MHREIDLMRSIRRHAAVRGRARILAGWLSALLLLTACGCSMTTHAERKEKAEQHWGRVRSGVKLQMARQQFERGQTAEALRFLDEALAWDRENAEVFLLLAQCRLEEGKLAAAQRAIDQAVRYSAEPKPLIIAMQGLIAERRGDYAQAAEFYGQARALDDTQVDYLVSEAECFVSQGKITEARELLRANLLEYDNNPSLHAVLGEIALREGDNATARAEFRAVLAAGKYDPMIAEEYALLAVRSGQYHEALTVLEPHIREQGESRVPPSVLRATAECMLALQRTEPARKLLTKAVEVNRDDVHAWLLLARCGIALGDVHTTRRAADQVNRLAPQDPQSLMIEAYARVQEGRLDAAEQVLRQALKRDDQNALVYCMLGLVAERGKDPAAARSHYRAALRVDPACAWAQAALRRIEIAAPGSVGSALSSAAGAPDAEAVARRANAAEERP